MHEQMSLDLMTAEKPQKNAQDPESTQLEKDAFQAILPELTDILDEQGLKEDALHLNPLSDRSSISLISGSNLICWVRFRKKTHYLVIQDQFSSLLPATAVVTTNKSLAGLVRVELETAQEICLYRDAIRASLKDCIAKYHTWDCCGYYVKCSDARKCVHPNPYESIGCRYKQNLLAGKIFYGKNKNI